MLMFHRRLGVVVGIALSSVLFSASLGYGEDKETAAKALDAAKQAGDLKKEGKYAEAIAQYEKAVQLAEQAFTEELATLVSLLAERLSGQDGGGPKVFLDNAVTDRTENFERCQHLNVLFNDPLSVRYSSKLSKP